MAVDFSYSYTHPQQHEHKQDQEHEEERDQEHEPDSEDEEDDYIDMEVSSYYSNFLNSSPIHQPNEFEFRTLSGPLDRAQLSTTSPADELFYNGKLLPLHLLHTNTINFPCSDSICHDDDLDHTEFYSTPLPTNATNTPLSGTPFLSCNASPVESRQVSRELKPEEYFLESSKKSSWARKLKIKASRAYLKLFSSSKSKDDHKGKLVSHQSLGIESAKTIKDGKVCHRRSFSGAFKLRPSTTSSSSSSSSSSKNGSSDNVQMLKRSNSAKSELENPIAAAIAHCKQSSSRVFGSRKDLTKSDG